MNEWSETATIIIILRWLQNIWWYISHLRVYLKWVRVCVWDLNGCARAKILPIIVDLIKPFSLSRLWSNRSARLLVSIFHIHTAVMNSYQEKFRIKLTWLCICIERCAAWRIAIEHSRPTFYIGHIAEFFCCCFSVLLLFFFAVLFGVGTWKFVFVLNCCIFFCFQMWK